MKISSYNISANASHSYSGSVEDTYTQRNKNECPELSINSSVEDLVSISNAAREQDGQYWEERQNVKIQETSSLQQSNDSLQSSEITAKKETDPTPWHENKHNWDSRPSFITPEGLIPELVVTGTHQTPSGITIAKMDVIYHEATEEELESMREGMREQAELRMKQEKNLTVLGGNLFNNLFIKTEEIQLTEQTNVNMTANIISQDGRQIDIDLNLDLQQELSITKGWVHTQVPHADAYTYFSPETKLDVEDNPENTLSPLMFQLEPGTPEFSGKSFSLDLDGDGQAENLNLPDNGAAFLAFDANGDGQIQGTEIFNGFDELAAHDDDGNGWIDENDDIFQKLTLWNPEDKENPAGVDLLSADVGAIYLGSTKSSYTFRNEQGEELANLNSTGMFVRESSTAGHVFQMGIEKAGVTPEAEEEDIPDYFAKNPVKGPISDVYSQATSVPAQSPTTWPAKGEEPGQTHESKASNNQASPVASQTDTNEAEKTTAPEKSTPTEESAQTKKEESTNPKEEKTVQAEASAPAQKHVDMSALNLDQKLTQDQEKNINELTKQSDMIAQLQKDAAEKKEELSELLTSRQNSIKVDWYKSVKQMKTISSMFKSVV